MILLFTKKYGKISAGSNINEKGKSKAALAMRPFAYGDYELYKNKGYYNVNSADVKKSFFKIGEDVDKYMSASFILELTEKMLPENMPQPQMFNLLIDFLKTMEIRESKHQTIVLAYEMRALKILGHEPILDKCTNCGEIGDLRCFSIKDGGMICDRCRQNSNDTLIYDVKFDIVKVLNYFYTHPISAFGKIALEDRISEELQNIIRNYISYHLDIGILKSERIFDGKF